jgi:predicted O-methyltransferase YrrM
MKAIERTGADYYIQVSDVELIQKTMRLLRYIPICVNIGAAMGTSTLAMLEARADAFVFSIDIKDCPLELEALEQSDIEWKHRYEFNQGDSHESIGKEWLFLVDFVFVDGDHSYVGCYEDGRVWYKNLAPGGYIAFHDYEADMLPEVKRAVDAISAELGMEFVEQVGKLIVFRKPDENLPD